MKLNTSTEYLVYNSCPGYDILILKSSPVSDIKMIWPFLEMSFLLSGAGIRVKFDHSGRYLRINKFACFAGLVEMIEYSIFRVKCL